MGVLVGSVIFWIIQGPLKYGRYNVPHGIKLGVSNISNTLLQLIL